MKKIFLLSAAILTQFTVFAQSQTWTMDKNHAVLGFVVTHMMISDVEGRFTSFDIKLSSPDTNNFTNAVINVTADVTSINTDNTKRDDHLRGPDFFDVAQYPVLTFKSISLIPTSDKKYKLSGDLTMQGITKPVQLNVIMKGPLENPYTKKTTVGFKVSGTLKRSDFNIGSSFTSAMVSDEVRIDASAEFTRD